MSTKVRIPDVVEALKSWILRLDGVTPVYKTLIPPDHFYSAMSLAMGTQEDHHYPKVVIPIDGGSEEDLVGRRTEETMSFDCVFIFKKISAAPWNAPENEQAMHLLEDLKDLRRLDDTLGGVIRSMRIVEWTTDSGFAHPEAIIWIKLECKWENKC